MSTTVGPRSGTHKPTASASASIAPSRKSSTPRLSRKKLYQSLDELQADLDDWFREYNLTRAHSGKYCYGRPRCKHFWIPRIWRERRCSTPSTTQRWSRSGALRSEAQAEARPLTRLLDRTTLSDQV
jgi:hypothetical protein